MARPFDLMAAPAVSAVRTRAVLPVACAVFAGLTVGVASSTSDVLTTYGSTSTTATIIDLGAGFVLLAAGAITARYRPSGSTAVVVTSLGVAWLAPDWVGWADGPALARSVAMVVVPLFVPLVIHLLLSYPRGGIEGRPARSLLAVAYLSAIVTSAGRALVRDPFRDRYCWSNCSDNVFLLRSDLRATHTLDQFLLRTTIGLGVLAAIAAALRLGHATRVARSAMWFVIVPAAATALASGAYALLLLKRPAEDPTTLPFRINFVARAGTTIALGGGVVWGVWQTSRTRHAVMQLVDELGVTPAPGAFARAMARSLGDDHVTVGYWLPSRQSYVDASGRVVDPTPGRGQTTTSIVRNGERVAFVLHDEALTPTAEIGAAARLAVDNERLRAEVLAQLTDLHESQSRIVATADATRRLLERNLHDGAQQRLLAATFELRLAQTAAAANGHAKLATMIASASEQAQLGLTELRDLAHGIFPAILAEAGLEPAVRLLADKAALPVQLHEVCTTRQAHRVETAAYLVVEAMVNDATRRAATHLSVDIAQHNGLLVVEARAHGGSGQPDVAIGLSDRIGALGGRLLIAHDAVTAEIPCAS